MSLTACIPAERFAALASEIALDNPIKLNVYRSLDGSV
jgi:hypothetical protein